MKKILLVITAGIGMLTVTAQNLSLAFNGANQNRSYQVVIDGTSYYSNATANANTSTNGTVRTISIPGLQTGSHSLVVYRLKNNTTGTNTGSAASSSRAMYTNTIQLRQGYDMLVTVNGNGNVSTTERRVRTRGGIRNQTNVTPMATATFDALLRNTRARWSQSQRVAGVRDAFSVTTNYFTTAQARELLLLVNSEANRLSLAKLAYGRITDPANFSSLYDLFRNSASTNDLNVYIKQNPNYNNTGVYNGNNGSGTVTPVPTITRVAMDDATFNNLYQQASGHLLPWNRVKEVNAAFTNTAYYFSVAQINQLLSVSTEADKLSLAKLAWSRVTDPGNFNQVINNFSSQGDRDALTGYVQAHPF